MVLDFVILSLCKERILMNQYVTGEMIKRIREERKITQQNLAEKINISAKTVSKWETGRGYPDISLIESLAKALNVSVIELFAGQNVQNTNRTFLMPRMKIYVCPICGNIIVSAGETVVSCCGITLIALEAEPVDENHTVSISEVEDEYYVTVCHEMSKTHYISFVIAVLDDGFELKKLYPEGDSAARFKRSGVRFFYIYCNRHGLFKTTI